MDPRGLRQQVLVQEGKRRMEMEKLSLIDVSSEDDCLISSPSSTVAFSAPFGKTDISDQESCFSPLNSKESNTEDSEQSPTCWVSSESTKIQKGSRYNLRQSLAWDSAFFTNEGVLDCEELSFLITTFKRPELRLTEIQEEDQRSYESSIAVESDICTVKNLEVDLFKQMKTSKQAHEDGIAQDFDVPSLVNVRSTCSTNDTKSLELGTKGDLNAGTGVKNLSSLRDRSLPKQKSEKCSKELVTCLAEPENSTGEENKSATKSAKCLAKGSNPPTLVASNKKSVVPSRTLKRDARKVFPGKEIKVPVNGLGSSDSRSVTPVAKPSPRLSLESPRPRRDLLSRAASSLEGSASISSNSSVDMPLKGSRTKSESKNASLSAYVRSHSKISPSVSPVSSIDCLSSDSSSSTCTHGISQKLKGPIGDSGPSPHVTRGTRIPRPLASQKYLGDLDSVGNISLPSGNGSSPSSGKKRAHFPSNQRGHSSVDCAKPSGLRKPSPKIGFFDVANSPQGRRVSMLSGSLVMQNSCKSVDNNSGSKNNHTRYSPGLGSSDKCTKTKSNKPPDARTAVQYGKLQPSLHLSELPHLSASNTRSLLPTIRVMTCTRSLESKPCTSKLQKPSSITNSKRSSQVNASEDMENSISLKKHAEVRDLDAKSQGHVADLKQALPDEPHLQSALSQKLKCRKQGDACKGEANDDHNDVKVASPFMLASGATLLNLTEQHDLASREFFSNGSGRVSLEEVHAEDLNRLNGDINLEIGPEMVLLEQGLTKLHLESSNTIEPELESGRSSLAIKHTICNGHCEANQQAKGETAEFPSQQNIFVHNSVEDVSALHVFSKV
ncbi:unnamed protein product [Victoria cruziana]